MSECFATTDQMAAAGRYVSHEFGAHGYSVRIVWSTYYWAAFELRAGDGSRRLFMLDRYCNVDLAPVDCSTESAEGWQDWREAAVDRLLALQRGCYAQVSA